MTRTSGETFGPARLAARRPVAVTVTALAFALVGWMSWRELPIDLLPDLRSPTIVVAVRSGDRPPTEMERLYGEQVEQRLFTVRGLREVHQVARTGRLIATVRFDWDADMDLALIEVQKAVNPVAADPEVDEVLVRQLDPRQSPVITLGLAAEPEGPDLAELRRLARRQVAPAMEQLADVAEVRVLGGRELEVRVRVDRYRLQAFGVTLNQLEQRLVAENVDIDAGTLEDGGQVYLVRGISRFRNPPRCRAGRRALPHPAGGRRPAGPPADPGLRRRRGRTRACRDRPSRAGERPGGRRPPGVQGGRREHRRGLAHRARGGRRPGARPAPGQRLDGQRRRRPDRGRDGRSVERSAHRHRPGDRRPGAVPALLRPDRGRRLGGAGVPVRRPVRDAAVGALPEHHHPGWAGPRRRHAGGQRDRRCREHPPPPPPRRVGSRHGRQRYGRGRGRDCRLHAYYVRCLPARPVRPGSGGSPDRGHRLHRHRLPRRLPGGRDHADSGPVALAPAAR